MDRALFIFNTYCGIMLSLFDKKDANWTKQHYPVYPLNIKEEFINNVWYTKKAISVYFTNNFDKEWVFLLVANNA